MGEHKPDNHTRRTNGSLPRHLSDPRTLEIHTLKRVWKLCHSQMKTGDRKAVQRSSCNSPILIPAYNRERKITIYNLINTPNKAAILSGKSGMRPNLVSHHIWSSSRTCRRCPPSLWPSCREGASQQTAETSYSSNSRLPQNWTALRSAMPFVLRPLSANSLYTSVVFRILWLCCQLLQLSRCTGGASSPPCLSLRCIPPGSSEANSKPVLTVHV